MQEKSFAVTFRLIFLIDFFEEIIWPYLNVKQQVFKLALQRVFIA